MHRFNRFYRALAGRPLWLVSLAALPVVLAGCSQNTSQLGGDPTAAPTFLQTVGTNLVTALIGAVAGAILGAFCSQRAAPLRKWVAIAGLVLCVVGSILTSQAASGFFGFVGGFFAAYLALMAAGAKAAGRQKPTTFGSAEWADLDHLQNHNLVGSSAAENDSRSRGAGSSRRSMQTGNNGFLLGFYGEGDERVPLQYTGDRHLLTVAPTRSGKGVSAIVPNLLTYTGSVVVIDPKGENAMITADRRGRGTDTIPGLGQNVYVVDPWQITGIEPARFNPLDWLKPDDPDLSENTMMLADSMVVESNSKDPFWDEEAKALLMGLLLYVALDKNEAECRTLGRVRDLIVLPKDDFMDLLVRMAGSKNPIVSSTAARTEGKEDELRASVVASLQAHTHFLDSPRVRESLSASDFDFADLKAGSMSVYLVLPADRIDTFGRWLRLLVQQALTVNARNIEIQPAQPVLFLLDEMAALGKLSMVAQAYGLMAGFGIQLWGIVQDLSQLERIYGHGWQTFIGNSGVLQYFGSRDVTTAEYFSKLCGMQTVEKTSISKVITDTINHVVGGNGGGFSRSEGETTSTDTTQRPLMFPDELMVMRDQKEVVLIENYNPIAAHKQPWFEHPALADLGHNLKAEGRKPVVTAKGN